LPSSTGSNQIEIITAPRVAGDSTKVRVLECSRDPSIADRLESFGVRRPFSSGVCLGPAANLGVKFLAVVPPDPVVESPAIL